ncbi:MAG TPA: hypothetical protein ENK57_25435 [Polyangiaceae bacterium]|nr:hypothetical protein [Polyangiaceae bacterium]
MTSPSPIVIEVPWRRLNHLGAAVGSGSFAIAIGYLAATSAIFSGIYRGVMIAAAIGLGYWTATVALNRTRLELDEDTLRLSHGPLPWSASTSYPRSEIARLRANPQTRRLELRTRRGEEHVLMTALRDDVVAELNAALEPAFDP